MKIAVYKDTLANRRGADMAVENLAEGLRSRGHAVALFEKPAFVEEMAGSHDVIVSTGTNELLDINAWFARSTGNPALARYPMPVIQQFHTDPCYAFRHWIRKWRRNRAIRTALGKCAAIQVLRDEHVPFIRKIAPRIQVTVIGNWSSFDSVEILPTSTLPSTHTIVYPAAVNRDKNQRLLVDAFEVLKRDFPDWRFELYGKGTSNGFCDLREVYASCAIVAFPSKNEGFGLAIADAAAFGKPCVMIKDWIGTCAAGGGIVTAPTVRAYAEGLRRMMADAELRERMGAAARVYCAEHYSREKILDRWEAMLRTTVHGSGNQI